MEKIILCTFIVTRFLQFCTSFYHFIYLYIFRLLGHYQGTFFIFCTGHFKSQARPWVQKTRINIYHRCVSSPSFSLPIQLLCIRVCMGALVCVLVGVCVGSRVCVDLCIWPSVMVRELFNVQCSVILVVLPASPFYLLDNCFDINQVFCRFRFCILSGHTHLFLIYSPVILIPSKINEGSLRGICSGFTTDADMRKYNRKKQEKQV